MNVVREQTVRIDSRRNDSNDNDITVYFPTRMIECEQSQQLRISVTSFQCYLDFDNVNETNNQLKIVNDMTGVDTDITIPVGNYTFIDIVAFLNHTYPSMKSMFISNQNMFKFEFSGPHTILLFDDAPKLFGFDKNDESLYGTVSVTSRYSIDMTPHSYINIDVENSVLTQPWTSVQNNSEGTMVNSSTLCTIPMTVEPYSWQQYEPQNPSCMYLISKNLSELRLISRAYDSKHNVIDYMPNYSIIIKVETLGGDDGISKLQNTLDKLLEYQSMKFLSKHFLNENV
jgi:hypothetical protein